MKVVIATPLYPPEVGGPAAYAQAFVERFPAHGVEVALVKFSGVRRFPKFLKHLAYFFQVLRALRGADALIAFDTWSTGVPAILAAKLGGTKSFVRIGGDFLWETFVERTKKRIRLSEFYALPRDFSVKEKMIRAGTRWITTRADMLVFNTAWQRDLWAKEYGFKSDHARVIENAYPTEREVSPAREKVFVSAGRAHFLKNEETLASAFTEVKRRHPDIELDTRSLPPQAHQARIRDAYAVVISSVSEVSPNTAIDALRYGKPFIAPLDTGARERLGDAGIFVDTLDAGALATAMERLLDPEEYARACARVATFSFSHSWDDVVTEFLTVITKLCAS